MTMRLTALAAFCVMEICGLPRVLAAQPNDGSLVIPMRSTLIRRAVVIGVSRYNVLRDSLAYAASDAVAIAAMLREVPGPVVSDSSHIDLILNGDATKARVMLALGKLARASQRDDIAVIYFAGHGDVETLTENNDGYLLLADAPAEKTDYVSTGGLSVHELERSFIAPMVQRGVRVILITDACRSGNFVTQSEGGSRLTTAALLRSFDGVIKMVSSQPNELSYEDKRWGNGHGVFTYFLLEGIKGAARRGTSNNGITVEDLRRFIIDSVIEHTRTKVPAQNPIIEGSSTHVISNPRIQPPTPEGESDGSEAPVLEPHFEVSDPRDHVAGPYVDLDVDGSFPPGPSLVPVQQRSPTMDTAATRALRLLTSAISRGHGIPRSEGHQEGGHAAAGAGFGGGGNSDPSAWEIYQNARSAALPSVVLSAMADSLNLFFKNSAQRVIAEYQTGAWGSHAPRLVWNAARGLTLLPRVSTNDPDSINSRAKELFLYGYARMRSQDFVGAIALLDSARRVDQRLAVIHDALGRSYLGVGEFYAARTALEEATKRAPRWSRPASLLAELGSVGSRDNAQRLQALTDVTSAFDSSRVRRGGIDALLAPPRLGDPSAGVWSEIGLVYRDSARAALRRGARLEAERLYVHAVSLDPAVPSGFTELGAFYATDGRWRAAEQAYRAAIDRGLRTPSVFVRRGDALLHLGETAGAGGAYEMALLIQPDYPPAVYGIGSARMLAKDTLGAMQWLHRAYRSVRGSNYRVIKIASADALAHGWSELGRPDSAIVYWRLTLGMLTAADTSLKAEVHTYLGQAWERSGRWQQSVEHYGEALTLQRQMRDAAAEARTLSALGRATYKSASSAEALDRAVRYFDQAWEVSRRPSHPSDRPTVRDTVREHAEKDAWVLASSALYVDTGNRRWATGSLAAAELARFDKEVGVGSPSLRNQLPDRSQVASTINDIVTTQGAWYLAHYVTRDTLVRWVSDPAGALQVSRVAVTQDSLTRLLRHYNADVQANSDESVVVARELSRLLIPDELRSRLREQDNVIVIPHDVTLMAPYPELPVAAGANTTLGNSVKLSAQNAIIAIEPSQRSVRTNLRAPPLLRRSFIMSTMPDVGRAPDSTSVLTLIRERSRQLTGPVLGIEATEVALKKLMPGHDLVHIIASTATGNSSALRLAPAPYGDTILSSGAILRESMRLDSSIVILDVPLAGTGSLPAAFLSKGVSAVVAPLTADAGAIRAELLRMYRHWLLDSDGPNLPEALRRARGGERERSSLMLFLPAVPSASRRGPVS